MVESSIEGYGEYLAKEGADHPISCKPGAQAPASGLVDESEWLERASGLHGDGLVAIYGALAAATGSR